MGKTIQELTADLLAAPSACKEIKEAAQNYLDAVGKEGEAEAAKAYVAELEADIMPIDGLIAFAESDMGAKVFGADGVKNVLIPEIIYKRVCRRAWYKCRVACR